MNPKTILAVLAEVQNIPTYGKEFLGLSKQPLIQFQLRNGLKVNLRSKTIDRRIFNEIFFDHAYNPQGFEINETDTVVDIGGHIGCFTLYAAMSAPKGRVFTFEPSSKNFNILTQNILDNDFKHVKVFCQAIAKKTGKQKLYVEDYNTGANSLYTKSNDGKSEIVVTTSFADFLKKEKITRINFLKLDCEGAEFDLLYSLSAKDLQKIDKIGMEYHDLSGKNTHTTLVPFLEKNGFTVTVPHPEQSYGTLYAKRV